ncbi:MAG: hydantoinase/oxoprolinase family protein [Myxococcota bacterium]
MPLSPTLRIAVDTGGTFTDIIASVDGATPPILTHKLLSTPDDPAQAVLQGLQHVVEHLIPKGTPAPEVIHGSTVATNALLEGKGGPAALITTAGFEDTLHIGRQNRPELYALHVRKPRVPIPRDHCLGMHERLRYDGQPLRPLDPSDLDALPERLQSLGVEAVAVSLLHSYANPEHERQISERLADALPNLHVTLSHDLLPEFREYERASTCAVNAVVAPRMGSYLKTLADHIGPDHLRIMGSGGGSMTVETARTYPVHTVLSGPAGGVVGALAIACKAGFHKLITFDMGGTSTDVALCDGDLTLTTENQVGPLPIRIPMIDIHTVGAGGGSIAHVDLGRALQVGPESAGAWPGPACYGRTQNNLKATVTDAHVVLGHLQPERFLGGRIVLQPEAAHQAIKTVAERIGLDPLTTARGILRIAEATMARAIKVISVERGHDLRDFTLFTFGGAGGLHACNLAQSLGMRSVFVPRHPGLLSALGMLFAPCIHTLSTSLMLTITAIGDRYPDLHQHPQVRHAIKTLVEQGHALLNRESIPQEQQTVLTTMAMRYIGQSYELEIPIGPDMAHRFAEQHQRLYGTHSPGHPLELVVARARAIGTVVAPPQPQPEARSGAFPSDALTHQKGWPLVDRAQLRPGDTLPGPLIVTEYSSTTVIPAPWTLAVEAHGHLLITHPGDAL